MSSFVWTFSFIQEEVQSQRMKICSTQTQSQEVYSHQIIYIIIKMSFSFALRLFLFEIEMLRNENCSSYVDKDNQNVQCFSRSSAIRFYSFVFAESDFLTSVLRYFFRCRHEVWRSTDYLRNNLATLKRKPVYESSTTKFNFTPKRLRTTAIHHQSIIFFILWMNWI